MFDYGIDEGTKEKLGTLVLYLDTINPYIIMNFSYWQYSYNR